jgi:hypothetical protein
MEPFNSVLLRSIDQRVRGLTRDELEDALVAIASVRPVLVVSILDQVRDVAETLAEAQTSV